MSENNRSQRSHKKVTDDKIISVKGREVTKSKKHIRPIDRLGEYDEHIQWQGSTSVLDERFEGEIFGELPTNELSLDEDNSIGKSINDLDQSMISMYLHSYELEDCRASRIISQEFIDDLESILISYPFWDHLDHKDQVDLKMKYLDYYVYTLKLNAYVRYSRYMESLDDEDFKHEFDKRKHETKYDLDRIDDSIVKTIKIHSNNYKDQLYPEEFTTFVDGVAVDRRDMIHALIMQKNQRATNVRDI